MQRDIIAKTVYDRFLAPTEDNNRDYVGIEIEMPVVNTDGLPIDHKLSQKTFEDFIKHFDFEPQKYDEDGICISATNAETMDNLSFDCSYGNVEISFGMEEDINVLEKRFKEYVSFLNEKLEKEHHTLTGFGINPSYEINDNTFVPDERYRMLQFFLSRGEDWDIPKYFHPYHNFGAFASSSQVQLDFNQDQLVDAINAFSKIEPIKAVLFSNSLINSEPELLCSRDILWEDGPVGINPHNVGIDEDKPETVEDLVEYKMTTSIFNVERDGKFINFLPIVIADYFNMDEVEGEYYEDGEFHTIKFKPELEDIKFLRTYKYADITFRGTIEFRSCCNQPFSEAMTVAAFHAGLKRKMPELIELMNSDRVLYHHGYTDRELRRLMTRRDWPSYIDHDGLKELTIKVIDLAKEGLTERGYGEEHFLDPLYERAESLTSPGRVVDEAVRNGENVMDYVKEYAKLES